MVDHIQLRIYRWKLVTRDIRYPLFFDYFGMIKKWVGIFR